MPKNYIMYVIEPLNNIDENMFNQIKNASQILVYMKNMLSINENIIYHQFSYHKSIENMYNLDIKLIKKTRDLIMIGTINDKRTKLFNLLKINKYDIFCPNIEGYPRGIFEKEQDILLYSSKIVLLNNYYKNDIQYPRMIYNSANKIFFIYILNDDDNENLLDDVYNNLLVTCNSKNMFEVINYYLENEDKRIENVNILYDYVKNNLNVNLYLNI